MHRFFILSHQLHNDRVTFSDEQGQQIQKVLRLHPGQEVEVLDNSGWQYTVVLTSVNRKSTTGQVAAREPARGEPVVQVTLYQSVIKWDRFEWVLQKGTEIGVARFVPVITQRSMLKSDDEINPKKVARWQRIITEAAEQSRRGRLPALADALTLPEAMVESRQARLALMPWEAEQEVGVRAALAGAPAPPQSVALFIGPEGGFTEAEVAEGRSHNLIPVTLGRRILRAETAAIVAAALVFFELGEM